jgi:hypothetical protein
MARTSRLEVSNDRQILQALSEEHQRKHRQQHREHAHGRQSLARVSAHAPLLNTRAEATPQIPSDSVSLVVTSPPFLDVVDYAQDNWLHCWFAGVDPQSVELTVPRKLDAWATARCLPVMSVLRGCLKTL